MAWQVAAGFLRNPDHLLSVLIHFGLQTAGDLPGDVQSVGDIDLHRHAASCKFLPADGIGRDLFLSGGNKQSVGVTFEVGALRIELHHVIALLELPSSKSPFRINGALIRGFAAGIGNRDGYRRRRSISERGYGTDPPDKNANDISHARKIATSSISPSEIQDLKATYTCCCSWERPASLVSA